MNELQDAQTKLDEFTDRINKRFKEVIWPPAYDNEASPTGFGLARVKGETTEPLCEYYILPMIIAGGSRTREMETVDEYILDFENLVGVLGDTKDLSLVYRRRPEICHDTDFDVSENECVCNSRVIVFRKIED